MKAGALRAGILAIVMGLGAPVATTARVTDVGSWSRLPDMLAEHVGHSATLLPDGRVLIAGGTDVSGEATAGCELFDPMTNRWSRAASMNVARAYHTATLLRNGDVLVVGGQSSTSAFPYTVLASAEVYQPAQDRWITVRSAHVARARHSAVLLRDGRVLVAGGSIFLTGDLILPDLVPVSPDDRAEIYDPNIPQDRYHDPWSPAGGGMPDLQDAAFTAMPDGNVLATGGATAPEATELFDPKTNHWQAARRSLGTPRFDHTATLLSDDRVLLLGGYGSPQAADGAFRLEPNVVLTPAIFDLRGESVDPAASSAIPRVEHSATLLRSGLVLVVGSAYASNADSELFDPKNNIWISTGMPMDRYLHTATALRDGRVLIAGGLGVGSQKSAWIYSPSSIPGPSAPAPAAEEIAALGVLIVLITLGFAATTRRPGGWRRRRRADDAEWIDP